MQTFDTRRWQAVQAREPDPAHPFVYAVVTTGVFCVPGCPARLPRQDNVRFFDTAALAAAAGYRACKRCSGGGLAGSTSRSAPILAACRLIEVAETPPSLAALAEGVGLSTFHLQRRFKAETGLSPKAYAAALQAERLRVALPAAPSVTEALHAAGYSPARFYADAEQRLGMPPRDYRTGGKGATIVFAVGECFLGSILVARSQQGLCAILLGDDAQALVEQLHNLFPKAALLGGDSDFEHVVAEVVGFVERPRLGLQLPLDVQGTAFQARVWQALAAVAPGEQVSYTDIAERIGAPKAVRAVAQACAANRLAVAIPCHRVVRRDGDVSGYRWGVERKRQLLAREKQNPPPP